RCRACRGRSRDRPPGSCALRPFGAWSLPGRSVDCKALPRPTAPRTMRPMLATRAYRFAAQASLVARVYGGYKLIQALGRVGLAGADGHYARHHRRTAEAAYRIATPPTGPTIMARLF